MRSFCNMWLQIWLYLHAWEIWACWRCCLYRKEPVLHSWCFFSNFWWSTSEHIFSFTTFSGPPSGSSTVAWTTGFSQLTIAHTSWRSMCVAQNQWQLFSRGSRHRNTPQQGRPILSPSPMIAWHFSDEEEVSNLFTPISHQRSYYSFHLTLRISAYSNHMCVELHLADHSG